MATQHNHIRILVVSGDPLSRAGMAALLADQPGCNVVAQVDDGVDLAASQELYQPDVAVWDLGWDAGEGLEKLVQGDVESLPVVVLLPDGEAAAQAWAAGVRGVMLRSADVHGLVAALNAASQGLTVAGSELGLPAFTHWDSRPTAPSRSDLTPRELEVLGLLAEGLPNKTIAHNLGISEHTAKFHVNAILGKLGARSRTEAVTIATRSGLIFL